MLNWFRKKHKHLVLGMIITFAGGLFSMVCQNCYAYAKTTSLDSGDNQIAQHCMHENKKDEQSVHIPLHIHGDEACDCDDVTVARRHVLG